MFKVFRKRRIAEPAPIPEPPKPPKFHIGERALWNELGDGDGARVVKIVGESCKSGEYWPIVDMAGNFYIADNDYLWECTQDLLTPPFSF